MIYALAFGILISVLGVKFASSFLGGPIIITGATGPPHIQAGGHKVEEGIRRFWGKLEKPENRSWEWHHTSILWAILSWFVLGPALFVWGLRARVAWRRNPPGRGPPLRIVAALAVGGYNLLTLALGALAMAPQQLNVAISQYSETRYVVNRDAIAADLALMAFRAQTFYHLPVEDGGGGGQWKGIPGRIPATLKLEDISHPEPILAPILEWLHPQKPSHFVLEVLRKDKIAIWGIGQEMQDDPDFLNKDGQRGKLQYAMIVTPKSVKSELRSSTRRDPLSFLEPEDRVALQSKYLNWWKTGAAGR